MDFDFTTETITPESTGLITIAGVQGLEIPASTTANRPGSPVTGTVRVNTDVPTASVLEYWNGTTWSVSSGTVTSVSVVSANGLAGTVANASSTPAITLTTSITGVLVGNGTAISAATGSTSFPGYAAGLAGGVAGAIPYQTGPNATSFSLAGTSGQALISAGAGSPTWVNGNITIGTTTVSLGGTSTSLAGVTSLSMAGAINMNSNQINNLAMAVTPAGTDAVNVNYLQAAVSGLSWKQAVKAASIVPYTTTYANGTGGVGATLTNAGTQAAFAADGITFTGSGTERVLIKNQANSYENGIYVVTTLGSGSTNWVLTRSTDMDTAAEVDGAAVYVQQGGTIADTGWTQTSTMTAIGVGNPITWAQFSGSGSYTAGTGLTLSGNTFSLTNPVALSLGGTNANLTAVNGGAVYSTGSALAITAAGTTGQVLTSNGAAAPTWTAVVNSFQTSLSGLTPSTATTGAVTLAGTLGATSGGTGSSVAPTTGQFLYSSAGTTYAPTTLSSQAVTTFAGGTTGLTPAAATSGAITLAGTLVAVNGGTGINTYAIGDLLYANTTTTLARLADVAAGSYLRSGGVTTAPVWSTTTLPNSATTGDLMYASSANTYANLADVATGNALISGGVGAVPSWGKIGLTTHVSGILPIANGGTNSGTALSGSTIMVSNGTQIVQGTAGTTTTVLHGNAAGAPTYGAVVLTTDVSGILPLANGGTNANLTAVNGAVVYSTGTAMAMSAAGTTGQYLQSNGAAAPTWVTLTNGGLKFYSEFTTAPINAPSATASQSIALGTGSSAATYGVLANANGRFATQGDAQQIQAVLRVLTTATGSGNEMFLDGSGASQRLVLPANSAWTFNIKVVARRTDATGSYGSWMFTGLIYQDATAGTTTISGLSKTTIARIGVISGASNDPVVSADTTNGSLKVAVSGYGTYNIRWVATVDLAQVTN